MRRGTARRRLGGVRSGAWAGRRSVPTRIAHGRDGPHAPNIGGMQIIGAAPPTTSRRPLPRHRCRSRHDPDRQPASPSNSPRCSRRTSTALPAAGSAVRPARVERPPGSPPSLLGAVFLGVGAARLAGLLADVRSGAAANPVILPAHDPDEPVMALNVDVGDGRPIPKLVVGQFGAAVIRDLPDASVARHQGPYWEAMSDQGWVRIESPLDRAARDAERVRRWFAHDERDYVVRVYAAVVTSGSRAAPNPDLCGDQRVTARTVAAVTARAAQPQRRRGGRSCWRCCGVAPRRSGRGARTRTWNQRDISPPL